MNSLVRRRTGYSSRLYQPPLYKFDKCRHNRLDLLMAAGMFCGQIASRQGVWQGLLRLQGMTPVWFGGVSWGAVGGLVCDLPMTVVGTIYYNHREDIAVIEQHDDDDDEDED